MRSYELIYSPGANNPYYKTLLTTLKQYDAARARCSTSTSSNISTKPAMPRPATIGALRRSPWTIGARQRGGAAGCSPAVFGAGRQQGSGVGAHLYVGIGLRRPPNRFSVGAKVGSSSTDSDGLLAFIDINGDGLPDKVFNNNGAYLLPANQSDPGGTSADLRPGGPIATLPADQPRAFGHDLGRSRGLCRHRLGGFVGLNWSTTTTTQTVYFIDVNGDGLPDLVYNGTVWFNSMQGGVPTFTTDSSKTPYPVGPGAVAAGLTSAQQAQLSAKLAAANPLVDTIRRWVAP